MTGNSIELTEAINLLRSMSGQELRDYGFRVKNTFDEVDDPVLIGPDGLPVESWREGYPYSDKLKRKAYNQEKRLLQVELLKAQEWICSSGQRVVVLFEGRDAAGKGGTIKRFMEHLDPRHVDNVALSKPTETERGQWFFQRYIQHLPTRGRLVLFDRSWYNRAVVEHVMGYCTTGEYEDFMIAVPEFERMLTRAGILLIKLWFSVSRREQITRFAIRRIDPVRQWKLSPTDLASLDRWHEYTQAKEAMFDRTSSEHAPWTVVRSNDKKRGRLEAMRHVLNHLPYAGKDQELVTQPDPLIVGSPQQIQAEVGEDLGWAALRHSEQPGRYSH
ncbi:MAG: polyphosphate kinase 2 [Xanthomonadales bacterium]|nr:polyphosphate kinase 2 [Xanthomonadales bacterium]